MQSFNASNEPQIAMPAKMTSRIFSVYVCIFIGDIWVMTIIISDAWDIFYDLLLKWLICVIFFLEKIIYNKNEKGVH